MLISSKVKLDEHPAPGDLVVEMTDFEDVELITEKEFNLNALLEKRIRELEMLVETLLEEKRKDDEFKADLIRNMEDMKAKPINTKIPVREDHLSVLRGYKMIFKALANGACLCSCPCI